jgi:hypothetical protein
MNIKLSIINISSLIIKNLKTNKKYSYYDLYKKICSELEEEGIIDLFNLSLTFLYALNKINYNKNLDLVELIS